MRTIVALLLLCSFTYAGEGTVDSVFNTEKDSLIRFYIDLHAHPELSAEEKRTSAIISQELKKLGFEVSENIGGYGLAGVLKNGEGPTLMLRAEMDALPITEKTECSFASTVKTKLAEKEVGVMHACGHDIHMTCFIGTARILVALKDKWQGTLVMVAQPAEETGKGAKSMLAAGLFDKVPMPSSALALHVDPTLASNKVGFTEGVYNAATDSVDITVFGKGGHGAYPHTAKDPIVLASQIVLALQTIVSREVDPSQPTVITVGSIHGGTKHNVIASEVKLQLTVRTRSEEVRTQVLEAISRITKASAVAAGMPKELEPKIEILDGSTPVLVNNVELVRKTTGGITNTLGKDAVVALAPTMGGEDFAFFGSKIPIFMFRLGSARPDLVERKIPLPSLHSAEFLPDFEQTIQTGTKALSAAALENLKKQ